jgi:hypothetical protein
LKKPHTGEDTVEAVEPPCHVQPPVSRLLKKGSKIGLAHPAQLGGGVCRGCGKPRKPTYLSLFPSEVEAGEGSHVEDLVEGPPMKKRTNVVFA